MLTHLHIQNFTIVDQLNLDFDSGFSVITGETGAGKSLLLDAINLGLMERADPSVIRHDHDRCDITLCFDIRNNRAAKEWLEQHELLNGDECLLRRIIYRNQAARSFINGTPSPLNLVRELGALLLSIHSQHQHQTLMKRDYQQKCFDDFCGNANLLAEIRGYYKRFHDIEDTITTLQQKAERRDHELELLRYQHQELLQLGLMENEWEELSQKHQTLHRAQHIMLQLNQALDGMRDNDQYSATHLLIQALHAIEQISQKEPKLKSALELLNTASINLQEACEELDHYRSQFDLDAENLETLEKRLTAIHDLARKHRTKPEELFTLEQLLAEKILELESVHVQLEALNKEKIQVQKDYDKIASKLTQQRKKIAEQLNPLITKNMQALGIEGGVFRVGFEAVKEPLNLYGNERVCFEVITNPGQGFQPLNKIVSGGELSRVSFSLQVITAEKEGIPLLIFDEIDVGIGGKTASIVGKLLRELGEKIQVVSITHLPQVASQAHHHYQVQKTSDAHTTNTQIKPLTKKERVDEIARMLGGAKITQQTRAHAAEMLEIG